MGSIPEISFITNPGSSQATKKMLKNASLAFSNIVWLSIKINNVHTVHISFDSNLGDSVFS